MRRSNERSYTSTHIHTQTHTHKQTHTHTHTRVRKHTHTYIRSRTPANAISENAMHCISLINPAWLTPVDLGPGHSAPRLLTLLDIMANGIVPRAYKDSSVIVTYELANVF